MISDTEKNRFGNTVEALYKQDLVFKILYDKIFEIKIWGLRLGAGRACLLLFILPLLFCYMIGYYERTLFNTPGPLFLIGVIEDYTLYILIPVVLFSVYLYYQFSIFATNFLKDDIQKIIDFRKPGVEKIIDETNKLLYNVLAPAGFNRVIYYTFIFLFIIFWFLNLLKGFDPIKYYGKDIWHSWNHPAGFIYLKIINLVYTTILLAIFFYRFIAGIISFSILFRRISKANGFIIRPLSPDNSGGLKILSNLSLKFMYMVLPFFLIFISFILRGSTLLPGQQLGFLALIGLLFVTFFLPLGSVHTAMKSAKEKELENIAGVFSELNAQVKCKMANREFGEKFNEEIESLEKIDFLYDKTERMPVWPFNLSNLGRVALAALIPIVAFIIEMVTNTDSILYNLDRLSIFK